MPDQVTEDVKRVVRPSSAFGVGGAFLRGVHVFHGHGWTRSRVGCGLGLYHARWRIHAARRARAADRRTSRRACDVTILLARSVGRATIHTLLAIVTLLHLSRFGQATSFVALVHFDELYEVTWQERP